MRCKPIFLLPPDKELLAINLFSIVESQGEPVRSIGPPLHSGLGSLQVPKSNQVKHSSSGPSQAANPIKMFVKADPRPFQWASKRGGLGGGL